MADDTLTLFKLTVSIVSAYVSTIRCRPPNYRADWQAHTALTRVSHGEALGNALRPAIPVKNQLLRTTSSALRTDRNSSRSSDTCAPSQPHTRAVSREVGLSSDYPMVAPKLRRARSRLAKRMGLGQQRRTQVEQCRQH